ncbi:hypothetical protein J2X65_000658 [Ancylobacter sp. 3268]|nr:hypothetical protein [Ancylobacter sp. 3268]
MVHGLRGRPEPINPCFGSASFLNVVNDLA